MCADQSFRSAYLICTDKARQVWLLENIVSLTLSVRDCIDIVRELTTRSILLRKLIT